MSLFRGALKVVLLMLISLSLLLSGLAGPASAEGGSRYLQVLVTADDAPLDGVEVTILQWDDLSDEWTDTGLDVPQEGEGHYMTEVLGIGRYTVKLHDPESRWADAYGVGTAAPPVLPTAEGTFAVTGAYTRSALIVSALSGPRWTPAPTSGIQGVVRNRSRELVDGIVVEAFAVGEPDEVVASSITYGIEDPRQGPDHGFYSLVVPPGDYEVRFSDFEDRFISFEHADGPFSVFSNDWIRPAATEIPLGVAPSDLHGVVRDAEGQPLDGVVVEAYLADDPEVTVASALTYAREDEGGPEHGFYRLLVDAGEYGVRFSSLAGADPAYRTALHPDAPFVVGESESLALPPISLTSRTVSDASARVLLPSGAPLPYPRATIYSWNEEASAFEMTHRERGDVDGHVSVQLPFEVPAVVKIGRPGMVGWYSTGETLPEDPSSAGVIVGDGDVDLGEIRLLPRLGVLGQSAGDMAEYCTTRYLYRNDDRSTRQVPLPFELDFFGSSYDGLYINNNGNVTFNGPSGTFTPGDLTGDRAEQGPIIAPFFADVDTRGARSNVVTYGFSPDRTKLCINWAGVGFYPRRTSRLNTFQLVLEGDVTGDGRSPGDFDMTFNYDKVTWESGRASGGQGGLGGTSAAAGFSAGTGAPGTFVQLPGSLVNGALLDGGPNALTSGFQGSITPGRYVFPVRNAGFSDSLGGLEGHVTDEDHAGVSGAYVEACRANGNYCLNTATGGGGYFSFTGLPAGSYDLAVSPPGSGLFPGTGAGEVVAGEATLMEDIVLTAPATAPEGVAFTNASGSPTGVMAPYVDDAGMFVVHYQADLNFQATGCAAVVDPTYTQTINGVVTQHGPLTEEPPGVYSAVIPRSYPVYGDSRIVTNVPLTCGGDPIEFNMYIDPSGVVTDQYGRPRVGATVTLLRADSAAGPFTAVPDGSAVMSPSNRTNPDTTDSIGFFRWDVLTGWYQVRAQSTDCTETTTDAMQVPPERLDLLVKMLCPDIAAPVPTTAPALTGTPRAGEVLTMTQGAWDNGITHQVTEWLRDGAVVGTGSTYSLTAADVGEEITARVTATRPDYTQENGTGGVVTFTPVLFALASDVVAAAPASGGGGGGGGGATAPVNTAAPTIGGVAKVGQMLTANPGTWNTTGLTFTYQWLRDGDPISEATTADYRASATDLGKALLVKVTATKAGVPDATAVSEPVVVAIGDAPTALSPPIITGGTDLGDQLSVSNGSWGAEGLTFAYQWFRDGEPIAGADGKNHEVIEADQGRGLTARVTARKAGFADGQAVSGAVSVPEAGTERDSSRTRASLRDSVVRSGEHARLRVKVVSLGDAAPVGAIRIRVDGRSVKTIRLGEAADGVRTIRLPLLKPGKHRVRAIFTGSEQVRGSRSDKLSLKVKQPNHRMLPSLH